MKQSKLSMTAQIIMLIFFGVYVITELTTTKVNVESKVFDIIIESNGADFMRYPGAKVFHEDSTKIAFMWNENIVVTVSKFNDDSTWQVHKNKISAK